jgi:hypothetical protein
LLIAAVAGPNNVGKSSLFNTLVGTPLSPAQAEGGLTKQCLAVAHPSQVEGPVLPLLQRRYDVVLLAPGAPAPVEQPGPAGRLYLAQEPRMPSGLLLMDTPDFDSVYAQNRANAEALLVTVDVVVFVVSRQTYQNAALVAFLRDTVGAGRPFLIVYNEASNGQVAAAHLAKLERDVGQAPVARFYALHQPGVEQGAPLQTTPLGGNVPLGQLLMDPAARAGLKARALQAGLTQVAAELTALAQALESGAQEPERVLSRLRHELRQAGQRAAQKSVPADVLITAVRDELDARSSFHRWVRFPFRAVAAVITAVGRRARQALAGHSASALPDPEVLAEATLRDGLRRAVEALAPEVAAYRGDGEVRGLLHEAFGPVTLGRLDAPLTLAPLRSPEPDREALAGFCRQLVREELPGGTEEGALQALATLVYSVPASTAAAVTVATGGLGPDVVVWAGTLLTTPLMERFVDLLGAHIRENVQRRWSEAHGATLAAALEAELFRPLVAALEQRVGEARRGMAILTAARDGLEDALRGHDEERGA